jgi:hypothetical protein
MPIDYKKYPANWLTEIRPRILERDKNRCKHCDVPNHQIIQRYKNVSAYRYLRPVEWEQINQLVHKGYYRSQAIKILGFTKIVLTIAHLDQNINNNIDENLAALCQRCHIRHDSKYRKYNRFNKTGQLKLPI